MMIKCRYAADKLDIPVPAGVLSTYSTVAYKGLGWVGVFLADSSLIVTLLGVCCAYQINFATLMIDIPFINTHFSLTGLIIVNALLVAPLSLAKDLSSLASMSSVGLACIFLNIIAVMVYGYLLYGDTVISELSHHSAPISDSVNHLKHLTSFPSSISDAASYFGVVVFCFGICAFAFPIEETMSDCKQFYLAVTGCLVLVCGIYMIVGDGAVVLYNHDIKGVQGNILLNLPLDSWFAITARVSMAAVCITHIYLPNFNYFMISYLISCHHN